MIEGMMSIINSCMDIMNVTVPGTSFTFLSLGLFVLVITFAIGLFRFILGLPLHAAQSFANDSLKSQYRDRLNEARARRDSYQRVKNMNGAPRISQKR